MDAIVSKRFSRYARLRELLKNEITGGAFAVGERFYSERQIVEKFKVGRNVAVEALRLLEMSGMVERRQGQGTFIATTREEKKPKTGTIAVVISDTLESEHVVGLRLLRGMERQLKVAGYHLLLRSLGREQARVEAETLIDAQKADAYILWGVSGDIHDLFAESGAPAVVLGDTLSPNLPTVKSDHFSIVYDATRYLLELGHNAIGLLSRNSTNIGVRMGARGYEQALKARGVRTRQALFRLDAATPDAVAVATRDLLELGATAMIFDGVEMLDYGLPAIREAGRRVPEDISIAATEIPADIAAQYPGVTGYLVDRTRICETLVELILKALAGEQTESCLCEAKFREGTSCARRE